MPDDGVATIGFAFTIPGDFSGGGPSPTITLLWESPAAHDCNFEILPNSMYRARNGRPLDADNAAGGLVGVKASTPFILTGDGLQFDAPDPTGSVESMTFAVKAGPDEFGGPFKPGDAVELSFFRLESDTCTEPLVIDGASIEYEVAAPP